MSICNRCVHNTVCGEEGAFDEGLTYCRDFLDWTHVKAKVVVRGNCMICGKRLSEGEGIFFCKNCQDKIRNENDKRKKELENQLNDSVQNLIDQEMQKKPSLWWKCERCGKPIPYMACFCHECEDKTLGDPPRPFNPAERSDK